MKTQRTIGTAQCECDTKVCTSPAKRLVIDNHILDDIPLGKTIKLVVEEDVPPKRELVVPDDAVWQRDMLDRKMSWCLSHHTRGIVGKVTQPLEANNNWHAVAFQEDGDHEHLLCGSEIEAKRFIYEHLANDNMAGFSWKEAEPDWSRYECVIARIRYRDYDWQEMSANLLDTNSSKTLNQVIAYYRVRKKCTIVTKTLLLGQLPDGSVEIIDRWEKPAEEEKGN